MSIDTQYPMPPKKDDHAAMAVYARFMRHLRDVPHHRIEVRVLSAIQFTANMMDYSEAQIAKMLVDMGLRVCRSGFPADYLDFADASLMRSGWDVGGPSRGLVALNDFWHEIGEDHYAGYRTQYSLLNETTMMGAV